MIEKETESIIKESLKDIWIKWILRILAIALLIAFMWGWIDYRTDVKNEKHAKYLWWERNIPKGYPDTVYYTKVILDTVYLYLPRLLEEGAGDVPKYKKHQIRNSQKIDSAGR